MYRKLDMRLYGLFLLIAFAWLQAQAAAQSVEPSLSLDALVAELMKVNPDVQAAGARYEASLTRPSQENALPDPRVAFGWMSAGSLLPGRGLGEDPNANIYLQVTQEFPYPGKRGLKADAAKKEAENWKQMLSATTRSRIAALKSAYYELLYSYQALDLLSENQDTLRDLSKVAEARYTVGKAMQQDLIRAETQIAILQNQILSLEQKKQSLGAEINTLLNRPATQLAGRPEIVRLPQLEPFETLLAAMKQNSPMLLSQQAMIDSREASLQLARKDAYPDLELMSGYYNQGKLEDMWEVRAEIAIPIFKGSKQQKRADEATLELGEAKHNYRSTEQMIEFRLRDAYVKAETARNLMDLYGKQIVPQSQLALESSLAGYETGGLDFLTVLTNFTTILEYRMNIYEQQAEYMKALATIEELAGVAVEGRS